MTGPAPQHAGRLSAVQAVLLATILVAGLAVRLAGTGWDAYSGLQPDERHMVLVTGDMLDGLRAAPGRSVGELWFDTGSSPLNPRNSGRLYVYGEAPILAVTTILAALALEGSYHSLLAGRVASAVADTATILAVFALASLLTGAATAGLAGALLYAAAPTPLQLANFFTVDPWLVCASAWAILLLVLLARATGVKKRAVAAAGSAIGLALACKVTGAFLALPAAIAVAAVWSRLGLRSAFAAAALIAASAFVAFRLANPFAFAGPGLLDLASSQTYVDHMRTLAGMLRSPDFPPNWSWLAGYSRAALARDMVLFGAGPAIAIGFAAALLPASWRHNAAAWLVLAAALAPILLMLAVIAQPALRYGLPAIPLMAAAAGAAIARAPRPVCAVVAAFALLWASGIVRLHTGTHPRIEASRWLWTLPQGTVLAYETQWDEFLPVPLRVPGEAGLRDPRSGSHFTMLDLDMTAPDTAEKARRFADMLAWADYLAISSGRQRDTMPAFPDRFPMTAAYYAALSRGELCYKPVLGLDRGYPLAGLRIDDRWAQEPWRVYDHPVVEIFRRMPCFDGTRVFEFLSARLPPGN